MTKSKEQFERDAKLIELGVSLAGFAAARKEARTSYEWKLSFGVWALLAAAAARGFEAIPVVAIFFPLAYCWWLQNIWLRHSADAELTWNYLNEAQRIIEPYNVKIILRSRDSELAEAIRSPDGENGLGLLPIGPRRFSS